VRVIRAVWRDWQAPLILTLALLAAVAAVAAS
jgi:hypothetical protein